MKTNIYKMLYSLLLIAFPFQMQYGQAYNNVLALGPLPGDIKYFYIDTKIPFTAVPAPQLHITAYNYSNANKAIKLTLGWYVYANAFYWTQYKSDLGYYNPSSIRLGTYDDGGTTMIRIEIANDETYWSSYYFSATDIRSSASSYTEWTYHQGQMPAGTGNITTVKEYNGMVYTNNGNVGIGTTNPTSKLTVAGDIRAREVRVEANAGADFVFADDYHLRPLQEVEQFIIDNKHLPDIAPADSMVQNGVNISEMQIKLLQKIEELTLYTIEQQRQIDALKQEIKGIKKE